MTDPYVRGVTVERLRCLEIIKTYRAGMMVQIAESLDELARLIENPDADEDGA